MESWKYYQKKRDAFLEGLKEFLSIPSISTQEKHKKDLEGGAAFVARQFSELGLPVETIPTKGHPIVYSEWIQDQSYPTFLIYGHYDVQPPDPLDEWESPPFSPTVRDGKIYARGATDDKGQVWIHLSALQCMLQAPQDFPVNLKFCIEGEEEIGSPHLIPFIHAEKERLQADGVIISDTAFVKKGIPTISTGLRGLIYLEVEVQTVAKDLHSGSYGGIVSNPCHVLARIISVLHDEKGRITIPGLYDAVRPLSKEEEESLTCLPIGEEELLASTGAKKLVGEEGYSPLARMSARPTLDVNGLWGGYIQEGAKTVIPKKAAAKISMRLVPDQDPPTVAKALEEHLQQLCPPEADLTVKFLETGLYPYVADTAHPFFQRAKRALQQAFQTDQVVFLRQGGSIPFVPVIAKVLEAPCLLLGFGLPDDGAHSPNEHFHLDQLDGGVATLLHFYHSFGEKEGK